MFLVWWKFVPGHKYKNKKLYSLCIVMDKNKKVEDGGRVEWEKPNP
jgi:hypothetical protein